jgi:hypothetical protein
MKQSESNKILNSILKTESKNNGWKFSRGFVFKKEDDSFFTVLVNGIPKSKRLSWSLTFKHYEFDDLFWDIVKLPENKSQPLSFRACGAWVAPSINITSNFKTLEVWDEQSILKTIKKVFVDFNKLSIEISSSNTSLESNLESIEYYFSKILEKYPDAVRNIWVEKLLTCLLLEKYDSAREIAIARVNAGDSGGFSYAGNSFFQLACEHIESVEHT